MSTRDNVVPKIGDRIRDSRYTCAWRVTGFSEDNTTMHMRVWMHGKNKYLYQEMTRPEWELWSAAQCGLLPIMSIIRSGDERVAPLPTGQLDMIPSRSGSLPSRRGMGRKRVAAILGLSVEEVALAERSGKKKVIEGLSLGD